MKVVGIPERSYRRWQQRERQGRPPRGPWPAPVRDRVEPAAIEYADRFPAWGHRKIAMLMRVDGHHAPDSTVLRALKRTGRVLAVDYQAERRQHAEARRAAFVVPPSRPNQVWQLDFSEFETRLLRLPGGCRALRRGGSACRRSRDRPCINLNEHAFSRPTRVDRERAKRERRASRTEDGLRASESPSGCARRGTTRA